MGMNSERDIAENGNEHYVADADNYDVDYIIKEIGGTFGRFQIFNFIIYSIALCFCGMAGMPYVFTAMNLDYRCV